MTQTPTKLRLLIDKERGKFLPIFLGLVLVFSLAALLFVSAGPINDWIQTLENISYDLQLRHAYKPLSKDTPVVIVDIDDPSIAAEGRWPWPRKKLAELTSKLGTLGAKVIAFDLTFPEAEKNIVTQILEDSGENIPALEKMKDQFDYDALFAKSLSSTGSVLGFILKTEQEPQGAIGTPLLTITPELSEQIGLPRFNGYISNIAILESAAKKEGFINASPDPDGVLRFSPLLLQLENNIYGDLALQATLLFLGDAGLPKLLIESYGDQPVLEGIEFNTFTIPTDSWGRILIPFRGKPHTIPYVSAEDVMQGKAPAEKIQGKLVFIGSSATALGDLYATAIAPIYAGVEVHATIAAGILDHYFPYKPAWGKGASIALVLLFGVLCAILLPHLGPLLASAATIVFPLILFWLGRGMWVYQGIVLSVFFPIFIILILYVFNIAYGYFFESRHRKELRTVFGQYVPPACIDEMLKMGGDFSLHGETKELSVLFTDIRGFTSLSERFTAAETKQLLNQFLTPMTQVIFDDQGTIDKYVGDMIVAFWGAPLEDPKNAYHAVLAALDMQAKLKEVNVAFKAENKPELKIGIGVNTGPMSVGDMGSKFRRAYTVLGDAVNLASRLESLTKYYSVGIIIGEETQRKTATDFLYRKLDSVRVQGKEKVVHIYEPLCELSKATPDLRSQVDLHHKAFDAYLHQRWDEAELFFQQLASISEGLYHVYLQRIAHFRTSPPGPQWDGTYILESK
ncbi:MAG: adenylate/guanylate cyclase domain-containing protein [Verrucomicrobiota bacterium]|nr:adenylate/guanylate cyclase domain-containing protein [Verrucomicrobiota bacterium]